MKEEKTSTSKTALSGVIWTFGERISAQLVTLIVSIILARLLSPDEYAIVAIVMVFVTIANVFVTSGFGTALIQKLDADNIDFSSTLYFSLAFSFVLYAILFFSAPLISTFYEMPELTLVVRVLSIRLIFAAVNSVQQAYVAKTLQFKKFFYSTLIGTVISAVVGVGMAFAGAGIWALVMQYLTNVVIDTIVLSITSGWKPQLTFSWKRMKVLYSYGWKIMVSDVINKGCEQVRGLLLSKCATPADLSYYNQGQKFPALFINNIETSIQKVLQPIVSNAQEDKKRVLDLTRKSIQVSTFIIWPILCGLAVVGSALVEFLYTSKWAGCVPYLQLICLGYLFYPVGETHIRTIKALGRSDIFLKRMIVSQVIGFGLMIFFIVMNFGAMWIVSTWVISTLVLAFLSGLSNRKLIGYGFRMQIGDLIRTGVCCLIMIIAVYPISFVNLPAFGELCVQILVGVLAYIAASLIFNRKMLMYLIDVISKYLKGFIKSRGSQS